MFCVSASLSACAICVVTNFLILASIAVLLDLRTSIQVDSKTTDGDHRPPTISMIKHLSSFSQNRNQMNKYDRTAATGKSANKKLQFCNSAWVLKQ